MLKVRVAQYDVKLKLTEIGGRARYLGECRRFDKPRATPIPVELDAAQYDVMYAVAGLMAQLADEAPPPHAQVKELMQVVALRDIDPEGANVQAGDEGTVVLSANHYNDGCGPLVAWTKGGYCNVYEGDVKEKRA